VEKKEEHFDQIFNNMLQCLRGKGKYRIQAQLHRGLELQGNVSTSH